MTRALVVAAVIVLAAAACSLAGPGDLPYPDGCPKLGFSELRCRAILARAAEQAGAAPEDVVDATFLADVPNRMAEGMRVLAVVALSLPGGVERVEEVACAGIVGRQDDRVCQEDARILVHSGISTDLPCTGEPPAGCATLPPPPRPKSVAGALPLEVQSLDVPLPRVGRYDIEVGEAGLPDGYLSERRLSLAEARPTDFWIEDGVRLQVQSVERAWLPIGSRYRDPFDGVERVRVSLVFWVSETSPGAVLRVRDIVVR